MIHIKSVKGKIKSKCLIIFSPIHTDGGKPNSFGWWKQLAHNDISKVFIKDDSNTWYLSKNGESIDIEEIVIEIKNTVESVCNKKIQDIELICIGPSMGCFGAFLYGSLLKAKLCWGTSVTETLMLPKSRNSRYLKNDIFQISLSSYMRSDVEYHLLIGDRNIEDLLSASMLPDYVNIRMLKDAEHMVPLELKNRGISIANTVELLLKGFLVEDISMIDCFLKIKKDIPYYYMIDRKIDHFYPYILDNLLKKDTDFFLFNYIKAKSLYKIGKKIEALNLIDSKILNGNNKMTWDLYHFIGLVHRDLGNIGEAIDYFEKSYDLNPSIKGNIELLNRLRGKFRKL